MAPRVKTRCPHCQSALRIEERLVGQHVRCPACRDRFTVTTLILGHDETVSQIPVATTTVIHPPAAAAESADPSLPHGGPKLKAQPTIGRVGRFELKRLLGQGGFGRVYLAHDPDLSRPVALKVPVFDASDQKRAERFLAEGKAAARLNHPGIVAIYESGSAEGTCYIAAEFVDGLTLDQRLAGGDRPSLTTIAAWTQRLAEALHHAHSRGVVHRDIKPGNILIDADDLPRIMDFGLAKRFDDEVSWSAATADGSVLGTPAYMSPEQARGELERVGPASDQYSLGAVLYEILCGCKPFDGPAHAVISRVASQAPPEPRSIVASIPAGLEAICLQAMARDIAARYSDLGAMAADLERWRSGIQTVARPRRLRDRLQSRWQQSRRVRTSAVVGGVALLLLVVAAMGWRREQQLRELVRQELGVELGDSGAMIAGITHNHLKQIGLALHNYVDKHKAFPPAVVYGPDGKPWHSWRVLLLPYVGEAPLYSRYRFDEPWDGPNNIKLLDSIPAVYQDPQFKSVYTQIVVPTGTIALFPAVGARLASSSEPISGVIGRRAGCRGFADVKDGSSNTIMAGPVGPETRIPWMKPEDLDASGGLPPLGQRGSFAVRFDLGDGPFGYVLFADGAVRKLRPSLGSASVQAMLTFAGGETIDLDGLGALFIR